MIGGSNLEVGLDSVLENPDLDARLLRVRKTVVAVEAGDAKATHRLNQKIRLVLRSITDDSSGASASQRELATDLWQRQRRFDPRVLGRKAEQEVEQAEAETIDLSDPKARLQAAIKQSRLELSKPVSDHYEPGFVNAVEAVARVTTKYGSQKPQWSDTGHVEVLQVALGDLALDERSARQLWLSLAYANREGAFPGNQHSMLLSHICAFSNERKIGLPTPNCFKTFLEELTFRS